MGAAECESSQSKVVRVCHCHKICSSITPAVCDPVTMTYKDTCWFRAHKFTPEEPKKNIQYNNYYLNLFVSLKLFFLLPTFEL